MWSWKRMEKISWINHVNNKNYKNFLKCWVF